MSQMLTFPVARTYTCDVLVVGGGVSGISAAICAARMGVSVLLAERDGCLGGANLPLYRELRAIEGRDVIASGGVSFESDVRALAEMQLHGAIIGKALYEGKLNLARCIRLARGEKA